VDVGNSWKTEDNYDKKTISFRPITQWPLDVGWGKADDKNCALKMRNIDHYCVVSACGTRRRMRSCADWMKCDVISPDSKIRNLPKCVNVMCAHVRSVFDLFFAHIKRCIVLLVQWGYMATQYTCIPWSSNSVRFYSPKTVHSIVYVSGYRVDQNRWESRIGSPLWRALKSDQWGNQKTNTSRWFGACVSFLIFPLVRF
jgi:hypothetical protein